MQVVVVNHVQCHKFAVEYVVLYCGHFSASDLEIEFAEMRRLGLPTIFINSYLDIEEEEGEEEEAEVCGTVYGFCPYGFEFIFFTVPLT